MIRAESAQSEASEAQLPEIRVVFRVVVPDASEIHPSLDGGLHVIQTDGILNTYDSTGTLSGEIETDVVDVHNVVMDPTTGRVALAALRDPR